MRFFITVILGFAVLAGFVWAQAPSGGMPAAHADQWVYLDNGELRLGVDRSSGAAIAFLAQSGSERNFLNHFDRGRLVQQSYYGDSDGSFWEKKPWRYNPVQGGDYHGQGPRLLELRAQATSLYAKSIPRHWATGADLPECVLQQWITLTGKVAHVRFQMTYDGESTHGARHQEIPAIFVDASLETLVRYSGTAPWTGAALTRRVPGPVNEYVKLDENWAAYVDARDFGVGAYVPVAAEATCYRYLGGAGSDCSYVAPLATFALKPGLKFTYDAYLSIGSLEELRARFSAIHEMLNAK